MLTSTQAGIDVWTGFCGDAIRLRNRRMLIRTVWLLAIGASFAWLHPRLGDYRYWTDFFDGGVGKDDFFGDEHHRNVAYLLLGIAVLFLCLGGYTGSLYVLRRLDITRHPFARKLALRGPVQLVVPEIDGQYAAPRDRVGSVVVTSDWLLQQTRWQVVPMRLADIVWVYRWRMGRDYVNPTVADRFGDRLRVDYLTTKQKTYLYAKLIRLAPQAIEGYDEDIPANLEIVRRQVHLSRGRETALSGPGDHAHPGSLTSGRPRRAVVETADQGSR